MTLAVYLCFSTLSVAVLSLDETKAGTIQPLSVKSTPTTARAMSRPFPSQKHYQRPVPHTAVVVCVRAAFLQSLSSDDMNRSWLAFDRHLIL